VRLMGNLCLFAMLLAGSVAQASEWMAIGVSDKRQEIFVDVSSIKVSNNIRHAWIKLVYPPEAGPSNSKTATDTVGLMGFNCTDMLFRPEFATTYFADKSNESSSATDYPRAWTPIVPDSVQEAEMNFVCAWKPK